MSTALRGLGHFLPAAVERGGVARPILETPGGPSRLARPAALQALQQAGLTPADVDFLLFATMTPNVTFPGSGCYLQHELGCPTVGALDVRAQCTGFLYGLSIADSFLRAGVYRHVLLVGAEVHSSGLDYSELGIDVARRYGDGAGVALLASQEGTAGVLSTVLKSDGRRHRKFWCEYPASRQHPVRMTVENFRQRGHLLAIDCQEVHAFLVDALPDVCRQALAAAELGLGDIDRFYLAGVLPEAVAEAAERLRVGPEKLSNPAVEHGHLTAAALPVALSADMAAGRVGRGATICLAAAGAGFTWGAAVVRL